MAERVKVTAEGIETRPLEDGESVLPPQGASQDAPAGREASGRSEANSNAQQASDDLLRDLLGANDAENVEPVQVLVGEHLFSFGIRLLSERDTNALLRKRLRSVGGRMVPAADAEVILRVQALVQCVRRNVGTDTEPVWVPQWTLEEVEGTPQKKGLIDNTSAHARELIGDVEGGLLSEIWARNPRINPLVLSAIEAMMEAQARLQLGG